jgi:acyl carrier protein
MGLESVELLVEVEDSFDLLISDEAAERMRTVGDLADHLARRCSSRPVGCLTRTVFYRLRRALAIDGRVDRKRARPGMEIIRHRWRDRSRLAELLVLRIPRWKGGTLGELSREILARNYGLLSRYENAWNPGEVLDSVRRIVSDQTGVALRRISRETRFGDDLGF